MRFILSIAFLTSTFIVKAQNQIPNSNFENWTTAANGTDSLIGWSSSNSIVINPVISLYKDTSAYEADFAANLVTAPFGIIQYSTVGVLVNGEATFSYGGGGGGANVDYATGGGTPIAYKPTALKGFYKTTTLTAGDQPFAKVLLTKYNSTLNQRDTVSYAEYNFSTAAAYTAFSIPLVDLLPNEIPDTITTIFYSSDPRFVNQFSVWSNLYLDSLHLFPTITTDVTINSATQADIKIFPNPSTGKFSIENKANKAKHITIYNNLGLIIKSFHIASDELLSIDLNEYPAGLYYINTNTPSSLSQIIIITR